MTMMMMKIMIMPTNDDAHDDSNGECDDHDDDDGHQYGDDDDDDADVVDDICKLSNEQTVHSFSTNNLESVLQVGARVRAPDCVRLYGAFLADVCGGIVRPQTKYRIVFGHLCVYPNALGCCFVNSKGRSSVASMFPWWRWHCCQ